MLQIEIEWTEINWEPIIASVMGVTLTRGIFGFFNRKREKAVESLEMKRIYEWLAHVTGQEHAVMNWRSTRAIAVYNNLTLERVRYLCSYHDGIIQHSREKELWGIVGVVTQ